MTRDELFEVADKVGLGFIRHASDKDIEKFETFAKLVAQHEREWVGLTDEEIDQICGDVGYGYIDLARAIEAKLKEKNT
jgi:hypothetical protein